MTDPGVPVLVTPKQHLRRRGSAWSRFAVLPIAAYAAYVLFGRGDRRWEMFALLLVPPALAFGSARTRRLHEAMLPMWLTAVLYDSMRLVTKLGASAARVHVCDLRQHELDLFGFTSDGVKMTLQDYFLVHSSRAADLFFAIPYGTFIYVSVAFAIYLYVRDPPALRRYVWTFFLVNAAGLVTYRVYPAAPPWYFHAHGCTADLAVRASEGPHLAAVDAMLGHPYFASFYARSTNVFGAVPSLHVAYPLLIVLEGFRGFGAAGRTSSLLFAASMVVAAVYLDHHWVIDVLLGLTYAATLHLFARWLFARPGLARESVAA